MSPAGLPCHSEKARWRHALTWGNERVLILEEPLVSRGAIGQGVARRSRLLHHVTVIFTLQDERGTASSSVSLRKPSVGQPSLNSLRLAERRATHRTVATGTRRRRDADAGGWIEGHSHRVRIVTASAVSICSVYRA
jgi:hypothetical protein